MRNDVRLELLEVVVEIFDGVLLDGVGFVAKSLIVRQSFRAHYACAMIDQAAGSCIDCQLQPGIVDGLLNLGFRNLHWAASTSAKCIVRMGRPARSITPCSCMRQLESIETTVDAPVF